MGWVKKQKLAGWLGWTMGNIKSFYHCSKFRNMSTGFALWPNFHIFLQVSSSPTPSDTNHILLLNSENQREWEKFSLSELLLLTPVTAKEVRGVKYLSQSVSSCCPPLPPPSLSSEATTNTPSPNGRLTSFSSAQRANTLFVWSFRSPPPPSHVFNFYSVQRHVTLLLVQPYQCNSHNAPRAQPYRRKPLLLLDTPCPFVRPSVRNIFYPI